MNISKDKKIKIEYGEEQFYQILPVDNVGTVKEYLFPLKPDSLSDDDCVFVSHLGSDTNLGMRNSPLKTIEAAIGKLTPQINKIVVLDNSVYKENLKDVNLSSLNGIYKDSEEKTPKLLQDILKDDDEYTNENSIFLGENINWNPKNVGETGAAGGQIAYVNDDWESFDWDYIELMPLSTELDGRYSAGFDQFECPATLPDFPGGQNTSVGLGQALVYTQSFVDFFTNKGSGPTWDNRANNPFFVANEFVYEANGDIFSDFAIPTIAELNIIYNNLVIPGIADWNYEQTGEENRYWSSSRQENLVLPSINNQVWSKVFNDPGQTAFSTYNKDYKTRFIRYGSFGIRPDGTKEKPYTNINDAISSITLNKQNIMILSDGNYTVFDETLPANLKNITVFPGVQAYINFICRDSLTAPLNTLNFTSAFNKVGPSGSKDRTINRYISVNRILHGSDFNVISQVTNNSGSRREPAFAEEVVVDCFIENRERIFIQKFNSDESGDVYDNNIYSNNLNITYSVLRKSLQERFLGAVRRGPVAKFLNQNILLWSLDSGYETYVYHDLGPSNHTSDNLPQRKNELFLSFFNSDASEIRRLDISQFYDEDYGYFVYFGNNNLYLIKSDGTAYRKCTSIENNTWGNNITNPNVFELEGDYVGSWTRTYKNVVVDYDSEKIYISPREGFQQYSYLSVYDFNFNKLYSVNSLLVPTSVSKGPLFKIDEYFASPFDDEIGFNFGKYNELDLGKPTKSIEFEMKGPVIANRTQSFLQRNGIVTYSFRGNTDDNDILDYWISDNEYTPPVIPSFHVYGYGTGSGLTCSDFKIQNANIGSNLLLTYKADLIDSSGNIDFRYNNFTNIDSNISFIKCGKAILMNNLINNKTNVLEAVGNDCIIKRNIISSKIGSGIKITGNSANINYNTFFECNNAIVLVGNDGSEIVNNNILSLIINHGIDTTNPLTFNYCIIDGNVGDNISGIGNVLTPPYFINAGEFGSEFINLRLRKKVDGFSVNSAGINQSEDFIDIGAYYELTFFSGILSKSIIITKPEKIEIGYQPINVVNRQMPSGKYDSYRLNNSEYFSLSWFGLSNDDFEKLREVWLDEKNSVSIFFNPLSEPYVSYSTTIEYDNISASSKDWFDNQYLKRDVNIVFRRKLNG